MPFDLNKPLDSEESGFDINKPLDEPKKKSVAGGTTPKETTGSDSKIAFKPSNQSGIGIIGSKTPDFNLETTTLNKGSNLAAKQFLDYKVNKTPKTKIGIKDSFVKGFENFQTAMEVSGNRTALPEKEFKTYIENLYKQKKSEEPTETNFISETLGNVAPTMAATIGTSLINPIAGIGVGASMGSTQGYGDTFLNDYTQAREEGKSEEEAFNIASKTAIVGGIGGAVEGVAGAIVPELKGVAGKGVQKVINQVGKLAFDAGVDASTAGASQVAQNIAAKQQGLNRNEGEGVLENMAAEAAFSTGINLPVTSAKAVIDNVKQSKEASKPIEQKQAEAQPNLESSQSQGNVQQENNVVEPIENEPIVEQEIERQTEIVKPTVEERAERIKQIDYEIDSLYESDDISADELMAKQKLEKQLQEQRKAIFDEHTAETQTELSNNTKEVEQLEATLNKMDNKTRGYEVGKNKLKSLYDQRKALLAKKDLQLAELQNLARPQVEVKQAESKPVQERPISITEQEKANKQKEKFESNLLQVGDETTINMTDGTQRKARYVLVNKDGIATSHNPQSQYSSSGGFSINENFPQTEEGKSINDRDYTDESNAKLTKSRALKFDHKQAYDTGNKPDSTPTIDNNGFVKSGNDRLMSHELSSPNETTLADMKEFASKVGIDPDKVNENTRIVRQAQTDAPLTTDEMALFNPNDSGKAKTNKEVTTSIARKKNLGKIREAIGLATNNSDKIKALIDGGIIPKDKINEYYSNNKLTEKGEFVIDTVELADVLSERALDLLNDGTKPMNAVKKKLLKVKSELNNNLPNYNLKEALSGAIEILGQIKQDESLKDYLSQTQIDDKKVRDVGAVSMYEILTNDNIDIEEAISDFNKRAETNTQIANTGGGMFGDVPKTKEEILTDISKLPKQILQFTDKPKTESKLKENQKENKYTSKNLPIATSSDFTSVEVRPYTKVEDNKFRPDQQLRFSQGQNYGSVFIIGDPSLLKLIEIGAKRFYNSKNTDKKPINTIEEKQLAKIFGISSIDANLKAKELAKQNRKDIDVLMFIGDKLTEKSSKSNAETSKSEPKEKTKADEFDEGKKKVSNGFSKLGKKAAKFSGGLANITPEELSSIKEDVMEIAEGLYILTKLKGEALIRAVKESLKGNGYKEIADNIDYFREDIESLYGEPTSKPKGEKKVAKFAATTLIDNNLITKEEWEKSKPQYISESEKEYTQRAFDLIDKIGVQEVKDRIKSVENVPLQEVKVLGVAGQILISTYDQKAKQAIVDKDIDLANKMIAEKMKIAEDLPRMYSIGGQIVQSSDVTGNSQNLSISVMYLYQKGISDALQAENIDIVAESEPLIKEIEEQITVEDIQALREEAKQSKEYQDAQNELLKLKEEVEKQQKEIEKLRDEVLNLEKNKVEKKKKSSERKERIKSNFAELAKMTASASGGIKSVVSDGNPYANKKGIKILRELATDLLDEGIEKASDVLREIKDKILQSGGDPTYVDELKEYIFGEKTQNQLLLTESERQKIKDKFKSARLKHKQIVETYQKSYNLDKIISKQVKKIVRGKIDKKKEKSKTRLFDVIASNLSNAKNDQEVKNAIINGLIEAKTGLKPSSDISLEITEKAVLADALPIGSTRRNRAIRDMYNSLMKLYPYSFNSTINQAFYNGALSGYTTQQTSAIGGYKSNMVASFSGLVQGSKSFGDFVGSIFRAGEVSNFLEPLATANFYNALRGSDRRTIEGSLKFLEKNSKPTLFDKMKESDNKALVKLGNIYTAATNLLNAYDALNSTYTDYTYKEAILYQKLKTEVINAGNKVVPSELRAKVKDMMMAQQKSDMLSAIEKANKEGLVGNINDLKKSDGKFKRIGSALKSVSEGVSKDKIDKSEFVERVYEIINDKLNEVRLDAEQLTDISLLKASTVIKDPKTGVDKKSVTGAIIDKVSNAINIDVDKVYKENGLLNGLLSATGAVALNITGKTIMMLPRSTFNSIARLTDNMAVIGNLKTASLFQASTGEKGLTSTMKSMAVGFGASTRMNKDLTDKQRVELITKRVGAYIGLATLATTSAALRKWKHTGEEKEDEYSIDIIGNQSLVNKSLAKYKVENYKRNRIVFYKGKDVVYSIPYGNDLFKININMAQMFNSLLDNENIQLQEKEYEPSIVELMMMFAGKAMLETTGFSYSYGMNQIGEFFENINEHNQEDAIDLVKNTVGSTSINYASNLLPLNNFVIQATNLLTSKDAIKNKDRMFTRAWLLHTGLKGYDLITKDNPYAVKYDIFGTPLKKVGGESNTLIGSTILDFASTDKPKRTQEVYNRMFKYQVMPKPVSRKEFENYYLSATGQQREFTEKQMSEIEQKAGKEMLNIIIDGEIDKGILDSKNDAQKLLIYKKNISSMYNKLLLKHSRK